MELFVCLPTRDRFIMTQKTIDSLYTFSKHFEKINIYIFDNLSYYNEERILLFYKMLNEGRIKHYSYDTPTSLTNCFGKSVSFERWLHMMINDLNIKQLMKQETDHYYLLIDNDMLVGPNWDEYFLSASRYLEQTDKEKLVYFFIQYPGGVPKIHRDKIFTRYILSNEFSHEKSFELNTYGSGGGSGFWFMNKKQLLMMNSLWTHKVISNSYGHYKRHDTSTWFAIKQKHGAIKYNAAIKADQPLVLHLGGVIGSICNVLTSKKDYNELSKDMKIREETLKELTVEEIFEKFKNNPNTFNW